MGKFQNEKVNTTLYSREEGKRFFFPIPGNGKLNTNEMQTPSPKSLNIKKGCGCDSCGLLYPHYPQMEKLWVLEQPPTVRSQCSCEITMRNSQLFPYCIQVQTNSSPSMDQSGSASLSFRSTHPSVALPYYSGWQMHWRKITPNLWQNARGTF